MPLDTEGVTQLLDQSPNTKLHQECKKKREQLFTLFQAINRKGFMNILAQIWNVWAPKDVYNCQCCSKSWHIKCRSICEKNAAGQVWTGC